MNNDPPELATLDLFIRQVEAALDLEPGILDETSAMGNDLGFDSVLMMELLLVAEELGAEVPDDADAPALTMNDLYMLYIRNAVDAP